jgi:anaerobic selenocysteine-containing dehydrogenase
VAQVLFGRLASKFPAYQKAQALPWSAWASDYRLIRDEIAQIIPGFLRFNERLSKAGGFELENGPRERRFENNEKLALFVAPPVRRLQLLDGELMLMTLRSHDQFNTTIYSNTDRYRGITEQRRVLLLHPSDLAARELKAGAPIEVTSYFRDETRSVTGFFALPYDVPPGTAVAYFPEANPLIFAESYAAQSRTPTSKSVRIRVRAALQVGQRSEPVP